MTFFDEPTCKESVTPYRPANPSDIPFALDTHSSMVRPALFIISTAMKDAGENTWSLMNDFKVPAVRGSMFSFMNSYTLKSSS